MRAMSQLGIVFNNNTLSHYYLGVPRTIDNIVEPRGNANRLISHVRQTVDAKVSKVVGADDVLTCTEGMGRYRPDLSALGGPHFHSGCGSTFLSTDSVAIRAMGPRGGVG